MIEPDDLVLEDFELWEALRRNGYVDKHWQVAEIKERVQVMRLASDIARALHPQVERTLGEVRAIIEESRRDKLEKLRKIAEGLAEEADCWCKRSIDYVCPPCGLRGELEKLKTD